MYLVTSITASKIINLGRMDAVKCDKSSKNVKDWTDKEMLALVIHVNLHRELTDVIATYGIDAALKFLIGG